MPNLKKVYAIMIFALPICGCASITDAGKNVAVVNDLRLVQGCQRIGPVSTDASGLYFSPGTAAMVKIRNKTAAMGGNTLYLSSTVSDFEGGEATGIVYRCGKSN